MSFDRKIGKLFAILKNSIYETDSAFQKLIEEAIETAGFSQQNNIPCDTKFRHLFTLLDWGGYEIGTGFQLVIKNAVEKAGLTQ